MTHTGRMAASPVGPRRPGSSRLSSGAGGGCARKSPSSARAAARGCHAPPERKQAAVWTDWVQTRMFVSLPLLDHARTRRPECSNWFLPALLSPDSICRCPPRALPDDVMRNAPAAEDSRWIHWDHRLPASSTTLSRTELGQALTRAMSTSGRLSATAVEQQVDAPALSTLPVPLVGALQPAQLTTTDHPSHRLHLARGLYLLHPTDTSHQTRITGHLRKDANVGGSLCHYHIYADTRLRNDSVPADHQWLCNIPAVCGLHLRLTARFCAADGD